MDFFAYSKGSTASHSRIMVVHRSPRKQIAHSWGPPVGLDKEPRAGTNREQPAESLA